MRRLKNILIEGRVEDAQKYFEDSVGSWPVAEPGNPAGIGASTNVEGVLDHFVQNDPSGNNKYLMWMVKMYLNPEEKGTSPNDISSLIQRFHKNVDRLTPELIKDMAFYSEAPISNSPRNIDSYNTIATLERVMDEIESRQTRKQKEKEAKKGGEKIYEDNRWLVVKPHTLEASCYYGAGTKWCTTSENTNHFKDYSAKGPLYYIIDKTRQLGRFYKIAMHVTWDGAEEYYDEEDNKLEDDVMDAIKVFLPKRLQQTIFDNWEGSSPPKPKNMSPEEFRKLLVDYVLKTKKQQTIKTQSGIWRLHIGPDDTRGRVWYWFSTPDDTQTNDKIIEVQATPFLNGEMEIPFDSDDILRFEPWSKTYGETVLNPSHFNSAHYLNPEPSGWSSVESNLQGFLNHIYRPLVKQVLDSPEVQQAVGGEYTTWEPSSYVSSYAFKYPPKKGSMTQLFTDYIKQNPRSTSNQFYMDVLGYPRPRAHNNMFFASIKDSGIVKIEREGRQFVYSLGPNYRDWTEGKLLRSGQQYR